ncbi:MAG: hypothetical protein U0J93_01000 [Parolsenella sp.]|uniref:hypothetical protein n=1 Tax=Parolsenella sp. TaxID=2083006 RepID=UPI002E782653|nr:hypothetical protein [Parolsenella sp.]MEE1371942.1 hypothetical protein [Parolsenella sp.]
MGRLAKSLNSLMLLGGASLVVWNLLLDERAKQSVRGAADQVVNLGSHLLNTYMEPNQMANDEAAAAYNRAWVEQQWREAGY